MLRGSGQQGSLCWKMLVAIGQYWVISLGCGVIRLLKRWRRRNVDSAEKIRFGD